MLTRTRSILLTSGRVAGASLAAKYGPDAGGVVLATARLEDDRVVVRVLDDGPGFPPDERERLF